MTNRRVTLHGGPLDNSVEFVREGAAYLFFGLFEGRRSVIGENVTDAAIYKESGLGYTFDRLASQEAT